MALNINLDGVQSGIRRLDLTEDPASFEFPREVEVDGPLRLALQISRDGSTVMVGGEVEANVRLVCGRCLTPLSEGVRAELREIYHLIDGPPPFRPEEDEGIHFVNRRAPRVDLAPVVREQVLLELPIKPLCRPDCRGLCPECGANWNDGPCGCAEPPDTRWNALGSLAPELRGPAPRPDAVRERPDSRPSNREERS